MKTLVILCIELLFILQFVILVAFMTNSDKVMGKLNTAFPNTLEMVDGTVVGAHIHRRHK